MFLRAVPAVAARRDLGVAAEPADHALLKRNRGVATRSGTLAARYQATVTIAAISEWLLPDV